MAINYDELATSVGGTTDYDKLATDLGGSFEVAKPNVSPYETGNFLTSPIVSAPVGELRPKSRGEILTKGLGGTFANVPTSALRLGSVGGSRCR